jgi:hypothetical protein
MKHLFGILLFSAIVIGSIATYKFLVVPAITEIPVIEVQERITGKPIVRKGDDTDSVYAVANKKTGEISVYLTVPVSRTSAEDLSATFSFYTIGVEGEPVAKMTATERLLVTKRHGASERWIYRYQAEWLRSIQPSANLYIMSKVSRTEDGWADAIEFSTQTAVAVLIKND